MGRGFVNLSTSAYGLPEAAHGRTALGAASQGRQRASVACVDRPAAHEGIISRGTEPGPHSSHVADATWRDAKSPGVGEGGQTASCTQSRCASPCPSPLPEVPERTHMSAGRSHRPPSGVTPRPPSAPTIVGARSEPRYTHASVKTTVAPLEGNKVKLSVEVDEDEFDKAINEAFRKIAREVRIPGFRPGKAPRKVLEPRLGSQVGTAALHDALPEYYAQACPTTRSTSSTRPRSTSPRARRTARRLRRRRRGPPVVQVPGYGGLRVEIPRPEPSDEEIDAQIDRLRQVQASSTTSTGPAREGDAVTVDIAGSQDGEALDGLTAYDYSYTIGSQAIIPEVDGQLTGAKAGDILEFEATTPTRRGAPAPVQGPGQGGAQACCPTSTTSSPPGLRVRHHRRSARLPPPPGRHGEAGPGPDRRA